ncbi:MAG TPA: hypothetical protein DCY13_05145 [Verrucomicrobiales bacterium]|nr:hypothetical protein [Verrucomicrobiales bacterium]
MSGAAALGHQTIWFRSAVDVLGANADTFARVVGGFFLGLALGAFIASRRQGPAELRWLWLALAEIGVALLTLPILLVAQNAGWLHEQPTLATWFRWLLPLVLVTPPALMMGLVLPWLLHALQLEERLQPGRAVLLYAVNTLGGVLGIMLVLLFALPAWGLAATALGLSGINLFVAAGFVVFQFQRGTVTPRPPKTSSPAPAPGLPLKLIIPAFGSGFLVLAMEVLFQLQFRQISINSLFSSGAVLCIVLLGLGAAPFLVGPILRAAGSPPAALASACLGGVLVCAVQPCLHLVFGGGLKVIPYELPAGPYAAALFGLALQTLALPVLVAGLVFPLLLHQATEEGKGRTAQWTGRLLMWNGVGGWLGAEAANRWLAPALGLWGSVVAVAAGYFGLFLVALPQLELRWRRPFRIAGFSAVATAIGFGWVSVLLPGIGLEEHVRLRALEVGREGVVAVAEHRPGDLRMVMNNTYTLGGSTAMANQERQAHLPILLHGRAHSVATLGIATGSTAGGATLHPDVDRVEAIELSPLVVKFAKREFTAFNRDVFSDPRVTVIEDDARWVVAQRTGTYDVVIGDLFMPWETGAGRLFTREHFENVRRSLKPDGLYCQWLPMFQLTRPQYESILRTFESVFGEVILLRGDFYAELPIIGLVGGRRLEAIDWDAVETACARLRQTEGVDDPLVRHREGVAMMIVGEAAGRPDAPLNTLGNAWLEFDAGRNIIGMADPWFVGVPLATHLRDVQRASREKLPVELRDAHESGQFFLTLEIASAIQSRELPALKSQFAARLPSPMREDALARWRHWPSRVKLTAAENR